MDQPTEFVTWESSKVCHLRKLLDGLKQSAQAGQEGQILSFKSLHRFQKDHSVFFHINYGKLILIMVYVDDIVITGDDAQEFTSTV